MSRREALLARLEEIGADGPKRSLGQNFLISDGVIDRILFAARSEKFTDLVEVGPGLGALTEDLALIAKKGGHEYSVIELDRRFAEYWRTRAVARVVEADALQYDWCELVLKPGSLFVSNLPYQISSSLVIERCLESAGITRMILMFQKEVAQRLRAPAANKEYGLLTVIAQVFWEISMVCEAGPRDFHPPPNVASRVLMFRRRKTDWVGADGATAEGFLKFTKAGFAHRRKLLARNLAGGWFSRSDGAELVERWLETSGHKKTARAEELDPDTFLRLYLAMAKAGTGA